MSRGYEVELGISEPSRHIRKRHHSPVLREELMREIVAVHRRQPLEPVGYNRITAKKECTRVDHLLRERYSSVEFSQRSAGLRSKIGVKLYQVAQWQGWRPAGKAVVTDVDDSADAKLSSEKLDNHPAVFVRDPGPDAMQPDDVEFRQIRPGRELGKGVLEQLRARASSIGYFASVRDLGGIEVSAPELSINSSGMDVDREALPEAELEIAQRLH